MIDVLIADDQNFVRKTLESYLKLESDLNIVGFAENGKIAVDQVELLKPDIVLMDIEMPIMDGLAATKTIAENFQDTKVLILSVHDKEQDVARALELGAKGYWLKNTTAQELADAIRYVHKGYFQVAIELVEKHFNRDLTKGLISQKDVEISNKLNVVEKVLAQIEQKVDALEEITPESLSETVENLVKQQVVLQNDKDLNLQFKLDRLRHRFNKLESKLTLIIKIQLIFNIILLVSIVALCFFLFTR